MKRIITLLILAISFGVSAQSLSLVAMDDSVWVNPNWVANDVSGKVYFQNTTSNDMYVHAKQAGPKCSLTDIRQICVGELCYPPSVIVTPDSFLVEAGKIDSSFSGHILTPGDGIENDCYIDYTFFDASNSNDSLQVRMWFIAKNGISVEENTVEITGIYPNPASDFVTVNYKNAGNDDAEFVIINMVGQVVKTSKLESTVASQRIDVSSLESGVYFYSLQVKGQILEAKRLVISK